LEKWSSQKNVFLLEKIQVLGVAVGLEEYFGDGEEEHGELEHSDFHSVAIAISLCPGLRGLHLWAHFAVHAFAAVDLPLLHTLANVTHLSVRTPFNSTRVLRQLVSVCPKVETLAVHWDSQTYYAHDFPTDLSNLRQLISSELPSYSFIDKLLESSPAIDTIVLHRTFEPVDFLLNFRTTLRKLFVQVLNPIDNPRPDVLSQLQALESFAIGQPLTLLLLDSLPPSLVNFGFWPRMAKDCSAIMKFIQRRPAIKTLTALCDDHKEIASLNGNPGSSCPHAAPHYRSCRACWRRSWNQLLEVCKAKGITVEIIEWVNLFHLTRAQSC
jgi:hypothetical protein